MDERMQKQLAFYLEIDKAKNVLRQTHLSGRGRRESEGRRGRKGLTAGNTKR